MMEIIIFTLNGIFVYLFSDWILRLIERYRNKNFENRSIIFFMIFLPLILLSFQVINKFIK